MNYYHIWTHPSPRSQLPSPHETSPAASDGSSASPPTPGLRCRKFRRPSSGPSGRTPPSCSPLGSPPILHRGGCSKFQRFSEFLTLDHLVSKKRQLPTRCRARRGGSSEGWPGRVAGWPSCGSVRRAMACRPPPHGRQQLALAPPAQGQIADHNTTPPRSGKGAQCRGGPGVRPRLALFGVVSAERSGTDTEVALDGGSMWWRVMWGWLGRRAVANSLDVEEREGEGAPPSAAATGQSRPGACSIGMTSHHTYEDGFGGVGVRVGDKKEEGVHASSPLRSWQ